MNDGASIHDNTCKTATIGLSTTKGGSSIVLNGGEIHHNTVTDAAKANVSVLSVPGRCHQLVRKLHEGLYDVHNERR